MTESSPVPETDRHTVRFTIVSIITVGIATVFAFILLILAFALPPHSSCHQALSNSGILAIRVEFAVPVVLWGLFVIGYGVVAIRRKLTFLGLLYITGSVVVMLLWLIAVIPQVTSNAFVC